MKPKQIVLTNSTAVLTGESGPVRVTGRGRLVVRDLSISADRTALEIDGAITIDIKGAYLRYTGGGKPRHSGLVLRRCVGGYVHAGCYNWPGNGVLVEAKKYGDVARVDFEDCYIWKCRGGLWLLNAKGCKVLGIDAFTSTFPEPCPHHRIDPAIIDERIVRGKLVPGETKLVE